MKLFLLQCINVLKHVVGHSSAKKHNPLISGQSYSIRNVLGLYKKKIFLRHWSRKGI